MTITQYQFDLLGTSFPQIPVQPNSSENQASPPPLLELLAAIFSPSHHPLKHAEVHSFATQLVREMKGATRALLKSKIYTREEIASIEGDAFRAVCRVGLLRLILKTNRVGNTILFYSRDAAHRRTLIELHQAQGCRWLYDNIVKVYELVHAYSKDQQDLLRQNLAARTPEVTDNAFRAIGELDLLISRKLMNQPDTLDPDQKIDWSEPFAV
jgi:hypothetical protein